MWRQLMVKMLTYGEVWTLTDLPRKPDPDAPNAPRSLQEQRDGGYLDPFIVPYNPLQVINYQESLTGELEWCIVQVSFEVQNFGEKPTIIDRWYYFDQTVYRIYEYKRPKDDNATDRNIVQVAPNGAANMTIQNAPINQALANDKDPEVPLLDEGLHALAEFGRCPIRRFKLPDHLWIANRAYLPVLDHFNQENTLAWALFMANLAMPVIIGDVDLTNQVMSETGFIQLPENCEYKWTEPEGRSFKISQERVNQLREEIYRAMYLVALGRNASSTAAAQSGFSKQMEMMSSSDILDALGSVVIAGMQLMLMDVADARGDDSLVFDVRGFHFEETISLQEIETIDKAINMIIPSETFEKELYRLVARSFLKDANPELMEQIISEIKDGRTRLEREMAMMTFEATLGLKPGVYTRESGSRAEGDVMITAGGTPTKQPYAQKSDAGKNNSTSFQKAAGNARNKSTSKQSPTTRPAKKAN
jgi:hypothetical protein